MEDDGDPYESLPGVKNTLVYMTAGAMAGVLEHCIMYPIDVVRTRMQSIRPQVAHRSFISTVAQLKAEKLRNIFRGMSAVVVGAAPAHALYFTCYEKLKQAMLKHEHHNSYYRLIIHGLSGSGATLVHDGVMTPVEVVKQRMQMYNSPFKTPRSCAIHILKTEGLKAFYRSYITQLTMNVPYQATHFVIYELMQDLTNRDRAYNPKTHIISGAVAGAMASAITNPLDVCKTLLNTQEKLALDATNSDRITGLNNARKAIKQCCGNRGFFQGVQARVVVAMPSTAISWFVYESVKHLYKET